MRTQRIAAAGIGKSPAGCEGLQIGLEKGFKIGFRTYKQRGEWVELLFMLRAAQRGFSVSKPWGDSNRYDVTVEHEGKFRRVQVKSTNVARANGGFICCLKRTGVQYYRLKEVDFFAIYVLKTETWFIMPARVVLRLKSNIRVAPGNKKQKYARYEEAWQLLLGRTKKAGRNGVRATGQ